MYICIYYIYMMHIYIYRPSGVTVEGSMASTRPARHGTEGPPAASMAVTPASVKRSAYDTAGNCCLTGSSLATILSRPALPPCMSSSLKRIVPCPEPPVLLILS